MLFNITVTTQHRMIELLVNNECGRMQKEAATAEFEGFSGYFAGGG
jgi:hypothetical protein